jgi:hypothetical protein
MKKGQVALEFVVLIGIALFVFLSLITIMSYHTQQLRDRKESEMVEDVAETLQNEISSASNVKDGYTRQFKLPSDLEGKPYTITKDGNKVFVTTAKYTAFAIVPNYTGIIQLGTNTINKRGGIVYINS